jgi:hypothetical protein
MEDRRLDLLLTYTIFHIGVYLSLTTAFMGATILGRANGWPIQWAVFWFLVAGACGGIVAANAAEDGATATKFFDPKHRLSLWGFDKFRLRWLTTIEHAAFWLGILPTWVVFLVCGGAGFHGPK